MMFTKVILFTIVSVISATTIGWIFWEHEIKYTMPTEKPAGFKDVKLGTKVNLDFLPEGSGKSTVLHFFNPDCPCSKFNMKDFESLSRKYQEKVNFIVVLQSQDEDAIDDFQEKYELSIPVIRDEKGEISDQCGIYSTPQAVILDNQSAIYFKGNYNKSRFCTRKETRYVEIALDSLNDGKPLPLFVLNETTLPYGCNLPSDETTSSLNFLNQ